MDYQDTQCPTLLAVLKGNTYWYVARCITCQNNKVDYRGPIGMLQLLPSPSAHGSPLVWTLSPSYQNQGRKSLTQSLQLWIISPRWHVLLQHIVISRQLGWQTYSLEKFLLPWFASRDHLYRDANFTSHFWSFLFGRLGTTLKLSPIYHPQMSPKRMAKQRG